MNKIISMSVWGNDPRYIVGAKRQIELAKKYYPDWKVRIYTDNILNFEDQTGIELHLVVNGMYGMFWRFLPMFEDPRSIVMVRDSDSRITIREARAIEEWLASDKNFHVFRDHDAHFEFPIIGCAFAYKGCFGTNLEDFMIKYATENKFYLSDQFFLRDHIYPLVKNSMMIHSMNDDGWFKDTREKLVNKYSFCGNGYDENDMPLYANSLKAMETFDPKWVASEYKFDEGILDE